MFAQMSNLAPDARYSRMPETFTYDAAGNLAYDGVFRYADAWNRLIKLTKGYRDSGGSLASGSEVGLMYYDGLGRRIIKQVKNSADLDCTYHYYLDGQSVIEQRNGSDQVLKQEVWGLTYVDELLQVALNSDPSADSTCDTAYWALQDANYNVSGVVDSTGMLAERYEYTPYGQRTVFFSPGTNDAGCHAPTLVSRRRVIGGVAQPWGLCEFGHQGLMHDEEFGLLYNWARMLHPVLGRFVQRDVLQYVSGLSLYEYVGGNPLRYLDPMGTQPESSGRWLNNQQQFVEHYFFGKGEVFDLGAHGLLKDYQSKSETQAAVRALKQAIEARLRQKRWQMDCDEPTWRWTFSDSRVTDVTWSDMFSLGRGLLTVTADCAQGVGNCVCCDGKKYPTSYWGRCSLRFEYKDRFQDPLDIRQAWERLRRKPWFELPGIGGDQVDLGDPPSEIPGGTPYAITGSWSDGVSVSGKMPVPCK